MLLVAQYQSNQNREEKNTSNIPAIMFDALFIGYGFFEEILFNAG